MKRYYNQFIIVILLLMVVSLSLVLVKSYFNTKEITTLIDGAEKNGHSYQLEITNPWTNDYSFKVKA